MRVGNFSQFWALISKIDVIQANRGVIGLVLMPKAPSWCLNRKNVSSVEKAKRSIHGR